MLNITTTQKGSTLTVCLEGKLDRNTSEVAEEKINNEMVGMEKLILYLEENEGVKQNEVIGYMNYYRAQGLISVIQKWVRDGFKTSIDDLIRLMTVLDGKTEECFAKLIKADK